MIRNFPEQFLVSNLERFDFGDAEAKDDRLLTLCPIPTSPMAEFLGDRKDIVLGFRGTGKSALVRLLTERKLTFKQSENLKDIVLTLDEELDYRSIREHLNRHAEGERSQKLMCRIVWEVLLIYKALKLVTETFGDGDSTIREHLKEIEVLLGLTSGRRGFFEILLMHKKKVGIKFDVAQPNIVDFYAGLDPSPGNDSPDEPSILKLGEYKRYLNRFLQEKNTNLYVLFDRLDDFVVDEEYAVQKLLLQGLLATQLEYRNKYPRVKVKAFLRTDLFRKLDLNEFGPDKILARCVELVWTTAEIRALVAKRFAVNIIEALQLNRLEIELDQQHFLLTREEISKFEDTKLSLKNFNPMSRSHWQKLFLWARLLTRKESPGDGRSQNSMDLVNETVITSIFPRETLHLTRRGSEEAIDLFNYLDTHFQLSHGDTTPRVMLAFLNQCLVATRSYYQRNLDIKQIPRNERSEYPLVLKPCIRQAYEATKKQAWDIQYQWARQWEGLVALLERLATSPSFAFSEFVSRAKCSEDDAKQFLAFTTHTGLVRCSNEKDRHEDRKYEFPILFQKTTVKKAA